MSDKTVLKLPITYPKCSTTNNLFDQYFIPSEEFKYSQLRCFGELNCSENSMLILQDNASSLLVDDVYLKLDLSKSKWPDDDFNLLKEYSDNFVMPLNGANFSCVEVKKAEKCNETEKLKIVMLKGVNALVANLSCSNLSTINIDVPRSTWKKTEDIPFEMKAEQLLRHLISNPFNSECNKVDVDFWINDPSQRPLSINNLSLGPEDYKNKNHFSLFINKLGTISTCKKDESSKASGFNSYIVVAAFFGVAIFAAIAHECYKKVLLNLHRQGISKSQYLAIILHGRAGRSDVRVAPRS